MDDRISEQSKLKKKNVQTTTTTTTTKEKVTPIQEKKLFLFERLENTVRKARFSPFPQCFQSSSLGFIKARDFDKCLQTNSKF